MRSRVWVRTLDYLVESCWLLAIVAVPIFFDTVTTRIFEPDKIVLFRNIVLVMLVALLLRGIITLPGALTRASSPAPAPREPGSEGEGNEGVARRPWWRQATDRNPMLLPVVLFTLVYTVATIHSVLPGISFWGSYDRMQGLYTWLSYIAFFLVLAYNVRTWAQIERIISAIVFASIPVAAYGIVQHLRWDPVQWGADTSTRVASTLGNAIFIGAYLLMTMPFTAYRLWRAVDRFRGAALTSPAATARAMPAPAAGPAFKDTPGRGRASSGANGASNGRGGAGARGQAASPRPAPNRQAAPRPGRSDTITITGLPPIVPVIGYALTLMLAFAALYFCGSRGPYYGFLFAVVTFGIILTLKTSTPYPAMGALALDIVLVGFPYIMNVLPPLAGLLLFVVGLTMLFLFIKPYPALAAAGLALAILSFTPTVDVIGPATPAVASTGATSSSNADSAHLTSVNDGDARVRIFIWQGTIPLVLKDGIDKLLIGHGPETMIYAYSPYYPSGLGHLERANAAPDRNHDQWLDFIVFSGVFGLLAWLGVLGSFAFALYRVFRRPITLRAAVVLAAAAAVFIGNSVEASVGIPIVSTLMLLWTMFALGVVFYLRPELSASAQGVVAAAQAVATSASAAAVPAGAAAATAGAAGGRGRAGTATAQRPRRGQAPQPVARAASFENLSGRQQGGLLGFILLGLLATVGAYLLFANNIQVVRADVSYKNAQAYDNVGTACLTRAVYPTDPAGQACPAGQAKQQTILDAVGNPNGSGPMFIPTAINLYQDAINAQPGQDMYYLWQGKAYLDEARYYQVIGQKANIIAQFQNAENVLKQAAALNPYNADHPMNLARMFSYWASIDPTQWKNADDYYRKATHLARHNGRWWDEWAKADMDQVAPQKGQPAPDPAKQKASLTQAIYAANHACEVDDLLGDARIYRGNAEQQLAQVVTDPAQKNRLTTQARDSYAAALRIGGFEKFSAQQALQEVISANLALNDYKALVRPIQVQLNGGLVSASPMALAESQLPGAGPTSTPVYSATSPYSLTTSQFGASLQAISATLRQKGLVK